MFYRKCWKTSLTAFSPLLITIRWSLLTSTKSPHHDLLLIRHAQSEYNQACEEYRKVHKIPYIWKQLCNHEGFDHRFLFNQEFIDTKLTDNGVAQCQRTRQLLKDEKLDCILVSPQFRALQTCSHIFNDHSKQVIVEPLLIGPIRSCCDINKSLQIKKQMFRKFDFSHSDFQQEMWYLDYLSDGQKQFCLKRFKSKGLVGHEDMTKELVQILKEGAIHEGPLYYRERTKRIKQKLAEYKKKFHKIGIVSHYYTIEYLAAKEYEICGTPVHYMDVKNCIPYYACLEELLAIDMPKVNATN